MKLIVPISSFLLALVAYFMTGMQGRIHTVIVYLYSIDAVQDQWRSKLISIMDGLSSWCFVIALISAALAAASIYHKFCNRIVGVILLIISILSVLFSLMMRLV